MNTEDLYDDDDLTYRHRSALALIKCSNCRNTVQYRTDANLIDTGITQQVDLSSTNVLAGFHDHIAVSVYSVTSKHPGVCGGLDIIDQLQFAVFVWLSDDGV